MKRTTKKTIPMPARTQDPWRVSPHNPIFPSHGQRVRAWLSDNIGMIVMMGGLFLFFIAACTRGDLPFSPRQKDVAIFGCIASTLLGFGMGWIIREESGKF